MSTKRQPFVSYVQHNFLSNFGLKLHSSDAEKLWVGKPLGAGSEGDVFFGTYDPPQLMAIKFIRKTPENSEKLETFLKISLKLNHPNITRLLAYSFDDEFVGQFGRLGHVLLVYGLHKCKSLRHRLDEKGHLKEDETRKFITDILEGLAYMHGRGISHNDLKPENIMIDCSEPGENEKAIIIDLNGACFFRDCKAPSITASYSAPESISRAFIVGPASDIWTVGLLTYELLTGNNPLRTRHGGAAAFIDAVKNLYNLGSPDRPPISDEELLSKFGKLEEIAKTNPETAQFITSILHMNPKERPSAQDLLQSSWITGK
jgi:serine/threonine protein kinase